MEKKTTVPPSAVARTAPCSAPGTSTQTTVTSAGSPTAAATASGSVASATTTRSARPAARSAAASSSFRTRPVSSVGAGGPGGGEAQAAGLAGRAEDDDRTRAGPLDDPGGGGRRSADVEDGEGDGVGQVVGQDGGDRAGEEDRRALGRHLLGAAVPRSQAVGDPQRGEGQRDEGGHPLPDRQPERRLRSDGVDDADEHAAGSGDRVLHLAAGPHDVQDGRADGVAVAAAGLGELPEGGGVEVQPLDRDAHLVGGDRRVGVEPQRRLGQDTRRLEHPVHPEGAFCRPCTLSLPSHPFDAEEPSVPSRYRRRFSRKVTRVAEIRGHDEPRRGTVLEQPYEYSARELVEPDWRRLPGFADVTDGAVAQRPVAARQLREEPPAAARCLRRPARRVVLRRRRGRPGRPRHHVAAAAAADAQHDGAR